MRRETTFPERESDLVRDWIRGKMKCSRAHQPGKGAKTLLSGVIRA